MRFLVLLLLTLTINSTAYSQITGISREQKVEIVSTIQTYEAVLIEINLHEQLLGQAREMIALLEKQLIVKDKMLLNLEAQIKTYNEQINVQDKEIRKEKFKNVLIGSSGLVLVILSLLIK